MDIVIACLWSTVTLGFYVCQTPFTTAEVILGKQRMWAEN